MRATENFPYLMSVDDWSLRYFFGVERRPAEEVDDPYFEYRAIELTATILVPALPKISKAEIIVWPNSRLNPETRLRNAPSAVGDMAASRAGVLRCTIFLPEVMYGPLLTLLAADKIRFLDVGGDKLRYGRGDIRKYSWDSSYSEEDISEIRTIWRASKLNRRQVSKQKARRSEP